MKTRHLVAVFISVILPLGLTAVYRLTQEASFTGKALMVYPLLFGGSLSLLILALNRFYLHASFASYPENNRLR